MASPTHNRLVTLRETQNVNEAGRVDENIRGWCYSAAKFFAGKMTGLFHPSRHLWDFYGSKWYRSRSNRTRVKKTWTHRGVVARRDFNSLVVMSAIQRSDAGIAMHSMAGPRGTVQEVYVQTIMIATTHSIGYANSLLRTGVPLIAAVDMEGQTKYAPSEQDHWVTLLPVGSDLWLVDPWGIPGRVDAVVKMPSLTLTRRAVQLQSSADNLKVPPYSPEFHFFRELRGAPLKRTLRV